MDELISCIITTYRRPIEILKRAVESVVNQTYSNIELIVVNDAPSDEILTQQIENLLNSYDISIKYIIHETNQGACAARNTGISNATGKYVAFLDDDDEWLPEKLSLQYRKISENNLSLVYCAYNQIDSDDEKKYVPVKYPSGTLSDFEKLLTYGNFIGSTSYPLIAMDALTRVGSFNLALKSSQDYELWLRIAQRYSIGYIDKPLVNYYVSEESISKNMDNKEQGFIYIINQYSSFYNSNTIAYNCRLNRTAIAFLKEHAYRYFFKYWIKAIIVKPLSKYNIEFLLRAAQKLSKR